MDRVFILRRGRFDEPPYAPQQSPEEERAALRTAIEASVQEILAFVSPTIQAFFLWQAAVGLVYSITMGRAAWNIIGRDGRKGFSRRKLREVWRFSAGMSLVAVSAIVLMQVDKAILTRLLSLESFGQYMLAVLISSSLYVLLRPLFNILG